MTTNGKPTIGFIGIGKMGLPMATRLLGAGFDVVASDVRREAVAQIVKRGARDGGSVKDVASVCETIMVSLPTPDIVRAVMLGASGVVAGSKRRVVVDLSTTGPSAAIAINGELEKAGVIQLDAPVSGGIRGAEKGTVAVMVSGPKAEADRLQPAFEAIGKYFYIGPKPGSGQMMKLANNLLSATNLAAAMEVVVLGSKAGLDPKVMVEVLNASSGRNTATEDKFPRAILPRTFDFGFAMGLMAKDVNLACAEAEKLGVPTWIGNAVKQYWNYGVAESGFDADFTNLMKHVEAWSHIQVGQTEVSTPRPPKA